MYIYDLTYFYIYLHFYSYYNPPLNILNFICFLSKLKNSSAKNHLLLKAHHMVPSEAMWQLSHVHKRVLKFIKTSDLPDLLPSLLPPDLQCCS